MSGHYPDTIQILSGYYPDNLKTWTGPLWVAVLRKSHIFKDHSPFSNVILEILIFSDLLNFFPKLTRFSRFFQRFFQIFPIFPRFCRFSQNFPGLFWLFQIMSKFPSVFQICSDFFRFSQNTTSSFRNFSFFPDLFPPETFPFFRILVLAVLERIPFVLVYKFLTKLNKEDLSFTSRKK